MRALAIPTALGGLITIWTCLAPALKEQSDSRPSVKVAGPVVISARVADEQVVSTPGEGSPTSESEGLLDWRTFIELQRAEVSAIATQIEKVRQESATLVNDLLVRRQMNSTGRWRGRIAELKAAQSLTDRRFEEWQDRDLELQQAVESFELLSQSLADRQEHPGNAASVIGKAALHCLTLSDGYREAGFRWSQAVQSECQLARAGRQTSTPGDPDGEVDLDLELSSSTTKTAALIGQQAMRIAECGERKMDGHQDRVRFTRRMRSLKVVGPLHTVDRLSLANQKLYADVRQVANSLTRDPDISSRRLDFLKNKLKTLQDQIARNTKELDIASKSVRISYPCAGGSCSR